MGKPRQSQWLEFVGVYSETVPSRLWGIIRFKGQVLLEQERDCQAFLGELVAGCQELMAGTLEEIVDGEIEAKVREAMRAGEEVSGR